MLVSKFYPDANLYEPVPPYSGKGRPRVKGDKVPTPEQVVAGRRCRRRLNVAWYGGGRREVEVVSGTAHWFKSGHGLVAVLWVYVHDLTGTHRDEYFLTTDVKMTERQVIETYVARWNEETTFQEMRSYVGLETTRGWKEKTVLRAAPCLFGLYTVVAVLFRALPASKRTGAVTWPGKATVTFSDALCAVRRWLWDEAVLPQAGDSTTLKELPEPIRELLLTSLAPAP